MAGRRQRRHGGRKSSPSTGPKGRFEIEIDRLGHRGDGVANVEGADIYVPYTLPGEKIVAQVMSGRGTVLELSQPSAQRSTPECHYFGDCGGCNLQHMKQDSYREWKRQQVESTLVSKLAGPVNVLPLMALPPNSRRRVTFSAERNAQGFVFGYNMARRHDIVSIEECPLLVPSISKVIPQLRLLATHLVPSTGRFSMRVTALPNGLDIDCRHERSTGRPYDGFTIETVSGLARDIGCARLSSDGETLLQFAQPQIEFQNIPVAFPAGSFLQSTEESEARLRSLVLEALQQCDRVADLFCGLGTFTFALSERAKVLAVDADQRAVSVLQHAAVRSHRSARIETGVRDLSDEPLTVAELNGFDGIVLDPPRKGALSQCREIAKSDVGRLASVSCDVGTFARDAQILVDGGYRLDWVRPVDQFLWSHHIELVGAFSR